MVLAIWDVLLRLAPWLFLGTAIAGFLHMVVPRGVIRRNLRGRRGVFQAVAFGVPLPLCSCSVIPAGVGLKKDGASDGAAIGFLISTPQTGIDSVMVSAGMLGWPFALFKVASAAITGIVGGFFAENLSHNDQSKDSTPDAEAAAHAPGWRAACEHSIEILRSIWLWLVIGVVVSAAITVLLPSSWVESIDSQGGPLLASLVALLISVPLYVCAVSSVPIAGALVAKGLPAGAAMVFLMAGPATNIATIGAIYRAFGRRILAVYLTTVIVGSILFALAFDWLIPAPELAAVTNHHEHATWLTTGSAVLLLCLFAWFAVDDLRRLWRRRAAAGQVGQGYRVPIQGMTCDGCAAKLEDSLRKTEGVSAARVQFDKAEALIVGDVDPPHVRERIAAAGFQSGEFEEVQSDHAGL